MSFDRLKKNVELATGIRIAYVEAGDTDGAPVILLHGFTDTSRSFFPTIEALVEGATDLHIFALDQRGYGASSMPSAEMHAAAPERCFRMSDMADDAVAFMDAIGIEKAHIVGHSMGSLVGQELALSHPERVESLMLIGTFVNGVNHPAMDEFLVPLIEGSWKEALTAREGFRWPEDAHELTPRDADPDAEDWLAENWVADPVASPAFLREILPETASTRLGTWTGCVRNLAAFDNRERLKQIAVPVCVIWATQENFFLWDPDELAVIAALDAAVEAGRTSYVFKTYGKAPLPASGFQESDIGHNVQFSAGRAVADDIDSWVTTGMPTRDLPYADPADLSTILIDLDAAQIIQGPR